MVAVGEADGEGVEGGGHEFRRGITGGVIDGGGAEEAVAVDGEVEAAEEVVVGGCGGCGGVFDPRVVLDGAEFGEGGGVGEAGAEEGVIGP